MHPQVIMFPCPACQGDVELGERGLAGLFRNLTLERVVERYRQSVSVGGAILCQLCKPPPLEATKGCTECRATFCNECFKLFHPWGTQKAQHEPTLPTLSFRPKVSQPFQALGREGHAAAGGWGCLALWVSKRKWEGFFNAKHLPLLSVTKSLDKSFNNFGPPSHLLQGDCSICPAMSIPKGLLRGGCEIMFVHYLHTEKVCVHSLTEQIFNEHLCARGYSRCWRYSSKQDGQG